jgi:hypothetical protein
VFATSPNFPGAELPEHVAHLLLSARRHFSVEEQYWFTVPHHSSNGGGGHACTLNDVSHL